ncbi:single-stranded-DNA-specific exonuclease RecJ [Caldithrix abyssi DSM 13497]|uniref:Single-stranded-DNA-specific exonuclease RecJ n=1 Tax=Caldithrix abyssi DSM 13497 TaxID=880073 RepID=H1XNL7_CALAY|nr:single-stranded-DNA-specific exonuclease RecJ [Caldithrix abyssi]APF19352.1 exonuclease RecJ [Caldithrix abyssi DSM 13497]EHO43255.1 single-stranded-DNA-specific exonuclease RecJ [Caldithrix abyssi DSM 13497]
MIYKWILPPPIAADKIDQIAREFDLPPIIARILIQRGIDSPQKVKKFYDMSLENLYDPFLLPGMEEAVDRIIRALREGENILIYGDYDVDGVTSVSILYDGLFYLGGKVSFFIPSRFREGYGVSVEGVKVAKEKGASLIITVDCGITAIDEVEFARELGIDVIICDHHQPSESIPQAVSVLNPKLPNSPYPYKELAGCGVAFKVLQALSQKLNIDPKFPNQYLDLVALGTAADIVQLLDENRIFMYQGLKMINQNPRPGLMALLESSGLLGRPLTVNAIVFVLAPRLNAVGRMSNAKKAVHLLTTRSFQQGRNIARILEYENRTRKDIDEITFEEALELIHDEIDLDSKRVLVLAKENWHTGVIGIVASRIMEKFNRPTILISIQNGVGKGSARSMGNFDIYEGFKKLKHLFINFGGHKFAAGITIAPENIPLLDREINMLSEEELDIDQLIPKLKIDAEITFDQLNAQFFSALSDMAPFGPGNMRPVFVSHDLKTYGSVSVVGNNHLKAKFKQKSIVLDAIGYNLGHLIDLINRPKGRISCAYVLEENRWNGRTAIQMRLKDIEVRSNG